MNHNLRFGLYLGFIQVIVVLAVLLVDPNQLSSQWLGIVTTIVYVGVLLWAGYELRSEKGGYINFKQGFISTFVVILIGAAITTLFNLLLYTVIIPDTAETLHNNYINTLAAGYEQAGLDDDTIDEAVDSMSFLSPYRPIGILLSYFGAAIGGAIMAVIVALVIRRKEPQFR
jgi:signal transduction histidine kinase